MNPNAAARHAKPSRPGVDLSRVDTGLMVHNLYVKIVPPGDQDVKSHALTRQALLYVTSRLGLFKQMGLKVNVQRVRAKDLKNPRLVEAMKKRGITNLPALTTPNNVYLGVKEIVDIYQKNTKEYEAFNRREDKQDMRAMDAPESELDRYYRTDMTFDRAEEDAQDESIGDQDTESMMRSYSRMMQRRETLNKDRKGYRPGEGPKGGGGGGPPSAARKQPGAPSAAADGRAAAPRPAQSTRPDNVHQDGDDEEITSMIDRINSELRGSDVDTAFASGGGDSLADDGGDVDGASDAQDKFMMASYWANQEDSLK